MLSGYSGRPFEIFRERVQEEFPQWIELLPVLFDNTHALFRDFAKMLFFFLNFCTHLFPAFLMFADTCIYM